jgi:crossover junction endodeoxyribonuclease RuvC
VLGIDPGTRRVGYGVIEVEAAVEHGGGALAGRGGWRYVECGVLDLLGEGALTERLRVLGDEVHALIREFTPRHLALELAYHGVNAASALKLGQARGVIAYVAAQAGLAVHEYAPARVKRAVVGHGAATKAGVAERVRLLFGLQHAPASDAADALAIALCHARGLVTARDGDLALIPTRAAPRGRARR